jgi:hypothetical protein
MEQIKSIVERFITYKIKLYIKHKGIQYKNKEELLDILDNDIYREYIDFAVDEDEDINYYLQENNIDLLSMIDGNTMFEFIQYTYKEYNDNFDAIPYDMANITFEKLLSYYVILIGFTVYDVVGHSDGFIEDDDVEG